MDPNTEIRKLRPAELYKLARILAVSDSWKMLMAVIPKEETENDLKFNTEHFALIEQASCQQRKSGAEIFLEEWSTMGKQRPTLKSMLDLLVQVQLFRAADYIAVDLLQGRRPERPQCGPAAPIDISDEEIAKLMERVAPGLEIPDSKFFDSKESLDSVLDRLGYPSQLSLQTSIEHHQQAAQHQLAESSSHPQPQHIGLELTDKISNLRIYTGQMNRNNSDLMQFSKTDLDSSKNNNQNQLCYNTSNLIQFSNNTLNMEENFSLANGVYNTRLGDDAKAVLERQNIACANSSNNVDEYKTQQIIREENIRVLQACNTPDTNESPNVGFINTSTLNSNNCSKFELQSSELPAVVVDLGKGSTSVYTEVKSSELPQFVVEIARQEYSRSGSANSTQFFEEPVLSSDSTLSDTSANFLTNVTSPSNDHTENSIPICVNFPSRTLGNIELVSKELPQFVADLGHRYNEGHLPATIHGGSEFSNASSNKPHTEQLVNSGSTSTDQYLGLNSEELPLVVSECNKIRAQLEGGMTELKSVELPQCVTELQTG